jgi:flagellar motor protein MotB
MLNWQKPIKRLLLGGNCETLIDRPSAVPYTTAYALPHQINAVFDIDMSITDCRSFWVRCQKGRRVSLAFGVLPFFLVACSVPDYANPVNWFDSKAEKEEIAAAKPVPGKDQSFPKLSSVPERPNPITIARIRKELTEGLIADTNNARYTDEIIRREPPAPPPRPVVVAKVEPSTPKPKLNLVKPPPPPKLTTALQPPAVTSVTSAETAAKTEASAVQPVPSNLKIVTAPAKQPASAAVPAPTATQSATAAIQPATTAKLARPAPPPPPPQIAALTTARPESDTRPVQSTQVATIFFGSATASLTGDDVSVLREVAALQLESGGAVRVVGHSSRGAPGANQLKRGLSNFKLSLDRANSVAEALIRFGVARDDVKVTARGDGELLYAETTAAGAAGNRRTEIFLEYF